MRLLPATKLHGARLVWLLDLSFGGRVYRLSTEPIVIDDDDGSSIPYTGGLFDVDYQESMDRRETSIASQTASMQVYIEDLNLSQERRRGFSLTSATAELSKIIVKGPAAAQTLDERQVTITGGLDNPMIDPAKGTGWASFTISSGGFADTAKMIPVNHRVGYGSVLGGWTAHEVTLRNHGKVYPLLIGRPGGYSDDGSLKVIEGSPAYVVDYWEPQDPVVKLSEFWYSQTLLIAGHHVSASHVVVFPKDYPHKGLQIVPTNTYDLLGQPNAVVSLYGQPEAAREASEFWVALGRSDALGATTPITGAGIANPFSTADLWGAGDVACFCLARSSLTIDMAAWRTMASVLNGLAKISTYINDPDVSPYEWLEESILPMLPVTVRYGPRGLFPVLTELYHRPASTMIALEHARQIHRAGPMVAEKRAADIRTVIQIEYAPRASEGEDDYQMVFTVGEYRPDDPTTGATVHSRAGSNDYVGQPIEIVSWPVVYDSPTAHAAARRIAREMSRVSYSIPYTAPLDAVGHLTVGTAIRLTDADLYITDQPCEVIELTWTGTEYDIVLWMIEDPARDDRS